MAKFGYNVNTVTHSFVLSPISEQGGLNFRIMGKGATNFGSHFFILRYHCN